MKIFKLIKNLLINRKAKKDECICEYVEDENNLKCVNKLIEYTKFFPELAKFLSRESASYCMICGAANHKLEKFRYNEQKLLKIINSEIND